MRIRLAARLCMWKVGGAGALQGSPGSLAITRASAFTTGACLMGTLVEEQLKWPPGSCIATSGNSSRI